jgi:WD40 repeat protein
MTLKATLLNHTKKINHLRLLANGQFLASASDDNSVKIWNTSDWSLFRILNKHTHYVLGLEVLTNETIASAHKYNIRISNLINGSTLKEIDTGSNVYPLKLLPISGLLTSGQKNGSIMIWDYTNAKLISILNGGHSEQVLNLELVSEQILASSARDDLVIIWNLTTNSIIFKLSGHTNDIYGLKRISSSLLASSSEDETIRIWNVSNGTVIRKLEGHTSPIRWSLDLLNEDVLISGSTDCTIRFWQISTGIQVLYLNASIQIKSLIFMGMRE